MAEKAPVLDRYAAVRAAKTADEIAAAMAGMETELEAMIQHHGDLERQRGRALAEPGGDPGALREEITILAIDIAEMQGAIAGSRERYQAAAKRENAQQVAALEKQAKEQAESYRTAVTRRNTAISELREAHAEVDATEGALRRTNALLESLTGSHRSGINPGNVRREALGDKPQERSSRPLSRDGARVDQLLVDFGNGRPIRRERSTFPTIATDGDGAPIANVNQRVARAH